MSSADALRGSLEDLAAQLESFDFRLPGPSRDSRERARAELVRSIREYLLPRLLDPDAPVVAVIVGPTGSGKSVMLNSLAAELASPPGALRPTTRAPVVWTSRRNLRRYESGFLAGLAGRSDLRIIAGADPLTEQLTLIDAPDFESVYPDSRQVGEEVLAVADLCIFVASALRYADAAAWEFLQQVRQRGLPILFVLNRLGSDPESRKAIMSDFAQLLKERDLLLEADPSLIFDVSEQVVYPRRGGLHADAVSGIRRELALISDPNLRRQVVRQSTEGAVADVIERVGNVAREIEADHAAIRTLRTLVDEAYATELGATQALAAEGALVEATGRLEKEVIAQEVAAALSRRAGIAAQAAAAAWDRTAEGSALLAVTESLWRHGPETHELAVGECEAWIDGVEQSLVGTIGRAGARRRAAATSAVTVLNGAGEPGSSRTEPNPRAVHAAGQGLTEVIAAVFAFDADRFVALAEGAGYPTGLAERLRAIARDVTERAGEFYQ